MGLLHQPSVQATHHARVIGSAVQDNAVLREIAGFKTVGMPHGMETITHRRAIALTRLRLAHKLG